MDGLVHDQRNAAATTLARMLAPERAAAQPPLLDAEAPQLTVAIATLALGGAERIVLDWAMHCAKRYSVRIIVLRAAPAEWPVPAGITVTRLQGSDALTALGVVGQTIAASGNPVVLCHLLDAAERAALARGGAQPLPVLHNAAAGWREEARALFSAPQVVTVSHAAAAELRAAGYKGICTVIHHLPQASPVEPGARVQWRTAWAIPKEAIVIGMVGAVKPQKAYTRALRLLSQLQAHRDMWLVIIGGPIGRDADAAWQAMLAQARRLQLESRVRFPGFVTHAARCLSAFDLMLNTSRYEGLSIATLEALACGLPVVASAVGGQGEIAAPALTLIDDGASDTDWVEAILNAFDTTTVAPPWRNFPSWRLWTLLHLPLDYQPQPSVLFITANLNAGGAQRSLCNLAQNLHHRLRLEVAVCGDSSAEYFYLKLRAAGISVRRSAASRDCFDHAEMLLRWLAVGRFGTICFWNADAKVKLLLVKALAATRVRIVDVSPGAYAFEEMQVLQDFQQWIAFDEQAYFRRLDRLVLKYHGNAPDAVRHKTSVIPNGVPLPFSRAGAALQYPLKIVVSGRITPTKFVHEIIESMRLVWQSHPRVTLHLLGCAEARHADYAREAVQLAGAELGQRIFVHGTTFDAPERLAEFDVALILGEHQGSPNAVLEALAAGVTVVANDSGGTRELVLHQHTGWLLSSREPRDIAAALIHVLADTRLAQRLATNGQQHVARKFSMSAMVNAYRKLLSAA